MHFAPGSRFVSVYLENVREGTLRLYLVHNSSKKAYPQINTIASQVFIYAIIISTVHIK